MKNLNVCKTCQGSDIPAKIIKLNIDLFNSFICQHFNLILLALYCIGLGEFPNELKHADVTPVYKKRINVIRSFSIRSKISKIYEKIYNQFYISIK